MGAEGEIGSCGMVGAAEKFQHNAGELTRPPGQAVRMCIETTVIRIPARLTSSASPSVSTTQTGFVLTPFKVKTYSLGIQL